MNQDARNDQLVATEAPSSAQTTTQQPPSSFDQPPIAAPPEKSNKNILIIALAILFLIVAGALGYLLTRDETKTVQDANKDTSSIVDTEETKLTAAQQTVGALKGLIAGEEHLTAKTDQYGGTDADGRMTYGSAAYQSGGQKFAIYPVTSHGFATTSTAEVANSDQEAILQYFTDNNFELVREYANGSIHSSEDMVCSFSQKNDTLGVPTGVSVGCADTDDYTKAYSLAEPFYAAYILAEPDMEDNLLLSVPTINDGVDGYKNATISFRSSSEDAVGGFAGLFSFNPTTSWSYFLGTQGPVPCNEYDTDELKKAFDGQECHDLTTDSPSTVKS